jgi:hypothetical protein
LVERLDFLLRNIRKVDLLIWEYGKISDLLVVDMLEDFSGRWILGF